MSFKHFYLALIIIILTSPDILGQDTRQLQQSISKKINDTKQLVTTKPDSALHYFKALRDEALKAGYSNEALVAMREIILIYQIEKGENNIALEEALEGEDLARKEKNYERLVEMLQVQFALYYHLSHIDRGLDKTQEALTYIDKIPDKNARYLLLSYLYGNISVYYQFSNNEQMHLMYTYKAIEAVKKISDTSIFKTKKYSTIAQLFDILGDIYLKNKQIDSAKFYYLTSYQLFNDPSNHFSSVRKMIALNSLSNFYYETQNYRSAINLATTALKMHDENKYPTVKRDLYKILYKSYLEINLIDSSKIYSNLYSKISDSLSHVRMSTANSSFEKLTQAHDEDSESLQKIMIIGAVVFTVTLLLIWYWSRVSKVHIHQSYEILIKKLNQKHIAPDIKIEDTKKDTILSKNGMFILDETAAILLRKLEKFENSKKFTKKDLTLTTLAHDLDTNTRYISEIIKEHRGKNFNAYLNMLRIQYITQKLYDEPQYLGYKIEYLAEISGFSSRQVFSIIFKKETGVTPSFFINQLVKEKQE